MTGDRRRLTVLAAGAAALLIGLFAFVLAPLERRREELGRDIERAKTTLADVKARADDLEALKKALETKPEAKTPEDFSLFAFLEEAAKAEGVDGYVESMRPLARDGGEGGAIAIRLGRIPLERLIGYLYRIENAPAPLSVKRLTMTPDKTHGANVDMEVAPAGAR